MAKGTRAPCNTVFTPGRTTIPRPGSGGFDTEVAILTWQQLWTGPLAGLALLLISSAPTEAGPGKVLEKAVKAKKGTYFLKSNLPYVSGRHPFGIYKSPLVACSAEGLNIKQAGELGFGWYHAEGRTMSLRINDQVKVVDVDYDDDEDQFEIEVEGTGRTDGGESVVALVRLGGIDEFERCWNEIFSEASIETKYEWPEAVKRDVLARRVTNGMTWEMVLVAVGNPERIDKSLEGGKETETWHIQAGEGSNVGFFIMSVGDKREAAVKFIDGVVVGMESASAGNQMKVK